MKKLLSILLIFLVGCATTSPESAETKDSCPAIVAQLQARYCELAADDESRLADGKTKNYNGWNNFTQDVANTAALCTWEEQPDFVNGCTER